MKVGSNELAQVLRDGKVVTGKRNASKRGGTASTGGWEARENGGSKKDAIGGIDVQKMHTTPGSKRKRIEGDWQLHSYNSHPRASSLASRCPCKQLWSANCHILTRIVYQCNTMVHVGWGGQRPPPKLDCSAQGASRASKRKRRGKDRARQAAEESQVHATAKGPCRRPPGRGDEETTPPAPKASRTRELPARARREDTGPQKTSGRGCHC